MKKINIFWFRRDLRLQDNAGLYHALKSGNPVLPVFIFDRNILDKLENRKDARVEFIHQELSRMQQELAAHSSSLLVRHGLPLEIWQQLSEAYEIEAVYTNRDYEPYARERDAAVERLLGEKGIRFQTFKDHVIFEQLEVTKDDGLPYTVFTPYSRKWMAKLQAGTADASLESSAHLKPFDSDSLCQNFAKHRQEELPTLSDMGFEPSGIKFPDRLVSQQLIREYGQKRDLPGIQGTSRLGIHFRFGTISIREKAAKALALSQVYLNELIWRDFYAMILWNFPHVATKPFRPEYEAIAWRNDEEEFRRWCEGTTGYPLVDAGMRELAQTGFMHNRVRMVTASFLAKHLLIDWRWGEAWFAEKLLDFDLASNNGGWQWAAGCGTDAAPYFRIFNPASQQQKFDKDLAYIKRWVPEYGTSAYPAPVVPHELARSRCLETYKKALGNR